MEAKTNLNNPTRGKRSAFNAGSVGTVLAHWPRSWTAYLPRVAPAGAMPALHRKKFRRTRNFLSRAALVCATGWEYGKRTYQEGKHIRAFWQGYLACRTRKPPGRTLKELYMVARKWKVLPFNYLRNALYDRTTPYADDFLSFIPEPALYTRYMPTLSPPELRVIVHNKYWFHRLLQSYDIPSPDIVLWSFDRAVYSQRGVVSNDDALREALDDHVGRQLVLKPQNWSNGKSIDFLSIDKVGRKAQLSSSSGEPYDLAQLYAANNRLDDWQMEMAIEQHPSVAVIYPHSVNTVRIVTLAYPDGEIRFLAALMRLGRNGARIDNASAGGIHVHVDPETGQITGPGYSKTDNGVLAAHPDTRHVFAGTVLPYWPEIAATARRGAGLFMHIHTIAWDIAITESGPVVIEGNPTWNPGTMERGSFPKGDIIADAAWAWQRHRSDADRIGRHAG